MDQCTAHAIKAETILVYFTSKGLGYADTRFVLQRHWEDFHHKVQYLTFFFLNPFVNFILKLNLNCNNVLGNGLRDCAKC